MLADSTTAFKPEVGEHFDDALSFWHITIRAQDVTRKDHAVGSPSLGFFRAFLTKNQLVAPMKQAADGCQPSPDNPRRSASCCWISRFSRLS